MQKIEILTIKSSIYYVRILFLYEKRRILKKIIIFTVLLINTLCIN